MATEYDRIGQNYSALTRRDPLKTLVQYPAILKLVGKVKKKSVLDIGCGNGVLSRALSAEGAFVVGFDIAKKQIETAKSFKTKNTTYAVSNQNFKGKRPFDIAICVMVLNYAPNLKALSDFFGCAYKNLKGGGKFVSVIFNPEIQNFGEKVFNRRFTKMHGRKIRVKFFNDANHDHFTAIVYDFKKADYEKAAKQAGFQNCKWMSLKPPSSARKTVGESFWKNYLKLQPYTVLVLKK